MSLRNEIRNSCQTHHFPHPYNQQRNYYEQTKCQWELTNVTNRQNRTERSFFPHETFKQNTHNHPRARSMVHLLLCYSSGRPFLMNWRQQRRKKFVCQCIINQEITQNHKKEELDSRKSWKISQKFRSLLNNSSLDCCRHTANSLLNPSFIISWFCLRL